MPSANLPIEYQEVEWLETAKNEHFWLDTGYVPNNDTNFNLKAQFGDKYGFIFGSRDGSMVNAYGLLYPSNGYYFRFIYGNKNINVFDKTSHVIRAEHSGNIVSIEDTLTGTASSVTLSAYTIESEWPIYVFGCNTAGTPTPVESHYNAVARLYYLTFSEGDETKVNLIPCYRKSDHVAGMYDTVSDTFLTNQGTGEFLTGPDVILLPPGYRRVEWLESSGTQWLDTGYVPTVDTWAECTFQYRNHNGGDQALFGSCSFWSAYPLDGLACTTYRNKWYGACGMSQYRSLAENKGTSILTTHNVRMTSTQMTINGDAVEPNYTATFNTNKSAYIFAVRVNNEAKFKSTRLMLMSLTFFEQDTPMVELVPCYRISDEKPGMYDLARNVFLTNQGTGEFMTSRAIYPSHERVTAALEMAWRRRALSEIAYANRSGKPIYRIKPPIGTTDTGIAPMTDGRPFTILYQQRCPTKPEVDSGNDYGISPASGPIYCIGEYDGYRSTLAFGDYGNYVMYCRKNTPIYQTYTSSGGHTVYPLFTPEPRRVACVVDSDKTRYIVHNLFGATQNIAYEMSDEMLTVTSRDKKVIDEFIVYDRVLTDEEISAYIQYGIVP